MAQILNGTWSSDIVVSSWLGQELLKVYLVKDGNIWDSQFYVPCLARMYVTLGSARKAISMFNERGVR